MLNGYLVVIAVFSMILIITGAIITKKGHSISEFFVAGRRLGTGLLFTTLIAPNIGAGSTVGVAGLAYKSGISAWWWISASALGSLILAFIVGPAIWRLAKAHNFYTLGDYLEHRYSKGFRGFICCMMAIGTLSIFSGQLMGVAWVLTAVAGTSKLVGVMLAATAVTVYFAAGGLLAAAFVNIIEITVKFMGFMLALPFAIHYIGGWDKLSEKIAENMSGATQATSYFSWDGLGITTIIGFVLMLTPSFFVSPGLIGKIYGASSERTVKRATALNALVQLVFAVVPVLLGMCAFAIMPGLAERDMALPIVMKQVLPFWLSALALAAIFSAEISAADAVLYMIATSWSKDLYKTFINPQISDVELLKITRVITCAAGVIGGGLALLLPNIITALSIFYSLMSVSLTAPLLFGLFSSKATTGSAFAAAVTGLVITVALQFGNNGQGIWILNAQSTGILVSLLVMGLFSITRSKQNFQKS